MSGRILSLSALSLLHVPPPDAVRIAARAGFDHLGLRLTASASRGVDFGMLRDADLRRRTREALDQEGMRLLDTEVVRITGDSTVEQFLPTLDASAELGSPYLVTVVDDPERDRAGELAAGLQAEAAQRGIRLALEFMVFTQLPDLDAARELVAQPGLEDAAILVDVLHLIRSGNALEELRDIEPGRLPYVQLCDAPGSHQARDLDEAKREAVNTRSLPGAGTLDLKGFLAAVPAGAAISVEVPFATDDPDEVLRLARATRAAALETMGDDDA